MPWEQTTASPLRRPHVEEVRTGGGRGSVVVRVVVGRRDRPCRWGSREPRWDSPRRESSEEPSRSRLGEAEGRGSRRPSSDREADDLGPGRPEADPEVARPTWAVRVEPAVAEPGRESSSSDEAPRSSARGRPGGARGRRARGGRGRHGLLVEGDERGGGALGPRPGGAEHGRVERRCAAGGGQDAHDRQGGDGRDPSYHRDHLLGVRRTAPDSFHASPRSSPSRGPVVQDPSKKRPEVARNAVRRDRGRVRPRTMTPCGSCWSRTMPPSRRPRSTGSRPWASRPTTWPRAPPPSRPRPRASTVPTSCSSTSDCPTSTARRSVGASARCPTSRSSWSVRAATRPTASSPSSSAPTTTSTKPYGMRELAARIRAVLRRTQAVAVAPPGGPQEIGRLSIDRRTQRVHVEGAEIGAHRQGVRRPGLPRRRPGCGPSAQRDPRARLGRPLVRRHQDRRRARGRDPQEARRPGVDRGGARGGLPARLPVSAR